MFKVRIRELRESAGYKSQQSFADAFGVAQSTIGGWESGKREPNYETTLRLADFFGTTVDYLMGRINRIETVEAKKEASPSEDRLAKLLQEPYMKEIFETLLNLTPESRRLVLAQIQAVGNFEANAKK